jgi:hypothetical protein
MPLKHNPVFGKVWLCNTWLMDMEALAEAAPWRGAARMGL